jgi:hypothetical protein
MVNFLKSLYKRSKKQELLFNMTLFIDLSRYYHSLTLSSWQTIEERQQDGEPVQVIEGTLNVGNDPRNHEYQSQINGTLVSEDNDLLLEAHGLGYSPLLLFSIVDMSYFAFIALDWISIGVFEPVFCKGDRFVFQTLNLLIFLFKLLLRRPNYLQAYVLISRLIPRKSRCRTFKSPGYYFPVIVRALSPIAHPIESSIASHSKIGI